MNHTWRWLGSLVLGMSLVGMPQWASADTARPAVPDFGLMLNDDGDLVIITLAEVKSADPVIIGQGMRERLDTLLETPVRTLVYQIAAGSDIMHYPSSAGSTWGWREAEDEQKPIWKKRVAFLRPATAAGLDSVRVAGQWARENQLSFFPSYRMNDGHYAINPHASVLTGEFWVEHGEKYELGEAPVPEVTYQAHLLDYSHEAVREYRLGIIFEAIDRYQDVMDGFQLDFMRNPILFPLGTASERGHLLTEMIRQIRGRLDEAGEANGRPYYLAVRVPPTPRNCQWAGLEIERWVREGLIDIIHPSPAMTLSHDMPVNEWVAMTASTDVAVYPALLDRTQFTWPFVASPDETSYAGVGPREPTEALVRGAVRNYLAMGAGGFELYNYNVPLPEPGHAAMRALAAPEHGDRVYTVTPGYWVDDTDTFEPAKAIPSLLRQRQPVHLPLYVGEHISSSNKTQPLDCALRLGLRAKDFTDPSHQITIRINGKSSYTGPLQPYLTPVTGRAARHSSQHPLPPTAYFQIPIHDLSPLRRGWNEVAITIDGADPKTAFLLVELQLGVLPK